MILQKIITAIVAFATLCLISWEMCTGLNVFCFTSSIIYTSVPRHLLLLRPKKPNVFPVHVFKGYRGSGGVAPFILNLGTRWS